MPSPPRRTKKRQTTDATDRRRASGRVYARDFDKVRPEKLVPGVVGRSQWFTQRAGRDEHALSTERLRRGLRDAVHQLDPASLRAQVLEDAHTLFANMSETTRKRSVGETSLLDASGRRQPAALKPAPQQKDNGLTALSRELDLSSKGMLVAPVDEELAADLDLETVMLAEISDPLQPVLDMTAVYSPQERFVAARIRRPGRYQFFAMPKDPSLRTALDLIARQWKSIERDPSFQQVEGGNGTLGPEMVDRIGEAVLSAPVAPADAGSRIKNLLGDLDLVDGALVKPPVIKWSWDFLRVCSRWSSIGPFPDAGFGGIGRVTQIAVHPADGNVLIAAAAGGGVWRTNNAGASWRPCMDLQPTLTMGAVAIAPSNPSIMYAASGEDGGGYNPAWSGVGIYRSSDGGVTWTLMTPVSSTRFSAVVVHPTRPDVIYVAGNRGLHKSVNGGVTWRSNPGLSSLFDGQITDVVVRYEPIVVKGMALEAAAFDEVAPPDVPTLFGPPFFNPEWVYIGVHNDGVYRSTNAGEQSWWGPAFTRLDGPEQLPSGADAGWAKLAIGRRGAHGQGFVVAKLGSDGSRIFTTADGGTIWQEKAANVATVSYDEWCSVIAVDPTDEDVMYAGAAGTLMRTTNGGANAGDWVAINTGIHPDQQDLAFDPRDSRRIYLGNDGGVFRSGDRGTNWTLSSGWLAITQLYDIDVSEHDRDIVAGGAQDNGIYYRNAAGVWRHIPWGDGTQVAIDPTDPQIFYFSSQNGLPNWLRRSVDGGASHQQLGQAGLSGGSPWITIIKLDPRDPIANPANNRTVFVCGSTELFRSTNGGQNWQRVEDGSGNPFQTAGTITALEFAPSDPSILYLSTSQGAVYRAVNGGANAGDWTRIDSPGSPADALFPTAQVQAISVNPGNPNHVWLVFGGSGVSFTGRPDMILNPLGISHLFRNENATNVNGWVDASGQFPALSLPDVPTSAAALADFDPLVAYAGTDVGVFRTTDGGVTWTAFQDGLPRSPVVELRFNRRFNRLFAGTMGRGVHVRDV
ncbi:MAG TPA: hypothetical protein VFM41_06525 [Gaiella sp.]|jgi:photosystem II stability/assembly factor-like uncharacterized protein|nr:hypothetical protein [Gaiella sp.]